MVFICNILTVLFNVTSTSNKRNRLFYGDYNLTLIGKSRKQNPENFKNSILGTTLGVIYGNKIQTKILSTLVMILIFSQIKCARLALLANQGSSFEHNRALSVCDELFLTVKIYGTINTHKNPPNTIVKIFLAL